MHVSVSILRPYASKCVPVGWDLDFWQPSRRICSHQLLKTAGLSTNGNINSQLIEEVGLKKSQTEPQTPKISVWINFCLFC